LKRAYASVARPTVTPFFKPDGRRQLTPKIVIVGAGTAGLVCAYRLQQRGIAARVIEASMRVGGRMFSLRNFFPDSQVTELGGEYIDSGHRTMRRLVDELGLKLNDLGAKKDPGDEHAYFFNNRMVPMDAAFIDLFRPVANAIGQDLKRMK